jgi:hypothetical protein
MTDQTTKQHSLQRTSPKGGPFIGTCVLCGQEGLSIDDIRRTECPNQRGLSQDEVFLETLDVRKP